MKKNSKNKKGFSFIELMITIAIMAIMSAVTLVSMNKGRELWAVKTAAREVAATVRETQNYALTGKDLKSQTTICNFVFNWGGSSYSISDCKEQSYLLKNGVNFSSSGSFYFDVPFANITVTTSPLPNPIFPVDINLSKGSSNYHVCVYASGAIKETADAACPAS